MIQSGLYSGYEIIVTMFEKKYKLTVKEGVRGINIPVHVTYRPHTNKWEACFRGRNLTVESVMPL